MGKIWLYTGDRPSNGAKELASQDDFLRLRSGRLYKVKAKDIVINWGVSDQKFFMVENISSNQLFNAPGCIAQASNKLASFTKLGLAGVKVVPWIADQGVAQSWCDEGSTIVVRNKLTGHSGEGIIIIEPHQPVPAAPLYTKYVFKEKEFRVHVVNGAVVDTQQKIKDPDREVVTWKVRSHANGFIFARNNLTLDPARDELAVAATKALGLDFGAVDIIQDKKGNLYVLEINTAPGLEGQTVQSYADAFRGYANGS